MKYLISGGGTGGHIYPALAILREIEEQDENAEILYVGTENSLEEELVTKEGIPFETVRVKGLPRKINLEFFKAIKELFSGLNDARKIIKEFKPDIAIGTGGYVSGPVILMAKLYRIPALIHESNALPGITNKILSRFVDKIALTHESAKKHFKNQDKLVVTGSPVRKEIYNIDKTAAYEKYGLKKDKKIVLSFGGSGGQNQLNKAILDLINKEMEMDFQLIHVTGKRLEKSFNKELDKSKLTDDIHILNYLYDMPSVMGISDLVIASPGATTLAEISAIGKPSILIPKSYSAENHQEYNAKSFEEEGASKMILESNLSYNLLLDTINSIIDNDEKLTKMSKNSKRLGNKDSTKEIMKIIEEIK